MTPEPILDIESIREISVKTQSNRSFSPDDRIWVKMKRILHHNEQRNFFLLMVLSLMTAFVQSIGIASFLPFMNLLLNLNSIHENKYLSLAYMMFKFQNDKQFVIAAGIVVGLLILISNGFSILNSTIKNKYILTTTHKVSVRLLKHYLNKPYDFILQKNTSELVKGVISDTHEFSSNFLSGIIDFIINLLMMIFILALLLFVNVQVTFFIIGFFLVIYGSLTFFSKSKLKKSGIRVMNAQRDKHKYAYEALNGFKISKALGIEDYFIKRYTKSSREVQKYQLFSKILSEIPKNLVEAMVFCSLAAAIVVIIIQDRDISTIIPTMSVYVIAGYRIMPEIAKVFSSISGIIHHRPVVDRIYEELIIDNADEKEVLIHELDSPASESLTFAKSLLLDNIVFRYKRSDVVIDHISMIIPYGSVTGFAGTTGAGKTTLIDIIMGLLKPDEGGLYIDNQLIQNDNVRSWRAMIGYVPQEIFLIDDTIRANIAFGIPETSIDDDEIRKAAKIASIADFIETELPDQYHSKIGERGVRLSGGQRQRLGLARALYRDPKVLILDEATSALDGATEESVVASIHSLSNVQTIIIIAHRLNTLKPCNQIYLLEHGQIIDRGTFDSLIENNSKFRLMAKIERT